MSSNPGALGSLIWEGCRQGAVSHCSEMFSVVISQEWTKPYLLHFNIYIFTMAPTLVGPWSCGHPLRGSVVRQYLTEQTRTNMSQRCGVGKISKHYGVGHGSVPCRTLFFSIGYDNKLEPWIIVCTLKPCSCWLIKVYDKLGYGISFMKKQPRQNYQIQELMTCWLIKLLYNCMKSSTLSAVCVCLTHLSAFSDEP